MGETRTASTSGISDADGLDNVPYSYQWVRNDGTDDSDISGATAGAYTLVSDDLSKTIKVSVSFTDDAGNAETVTSAATGSVVTIAPGRPGGLTVSLNDTGKLDLAWDAPESDGGSAITGYRVQWKKSSASWDAPSDVSETSVTGTSHTVTGLTDGVEYVFRVMAVNSVGDSEASTEESGVPSETTPPTVSSASVDGATLTITFSEDLAESPVPGTATLAVTVGGSSRGQFQLDAHGATSRCPSPLGIR